MIEIPVRAGATLPVPVPGTNCCCVVFVLRCLELVSSINSECTKYILYTQSGYLLCASDTKIVATHPISFDSFLIAGSTLAGHRNGDAITTANFGKINGLAMGTTEFDSTLKAVSDVLMSPPDSSSGSGGGLGVAELVHLIVGYTVPAELLLTDYGSNCIRGVEVPYWLLIPPPPSSSSSLSSVLVSTTAAAKK